MGIDVSNPLAKAENPEVYRERLYKLHVRCVQEIGLLQQKLNDTDPQDSHPVLQQRIEALQQRQNFYQVQLAGCGHGI